MKDEFGLDYDEMAMLLGFFVPFAAMLVVCGVSLVMRWMRVHQRKSELAAQNEQAAMEATLKQEMIQRGFSADEIERVLRAKMDGSSASGVSAPVHRQAVRV